MKLDKVKQISYRSTAAIVTRLDLAAAKLAAAEVTFAGDKLRTGHLVNAIALWVGQMSDEELLDFAKPKLEALADHLGRLEDAGEEPRGPSVKYSDTNIPVPRKRKGTSGEGGVKG
jgi:hypothetical protein